MLVCDETITIYHQTYDASNRRNSFTSTTIHGCSWYSKIQAQMLEKGLKSEDMYYVRIPFESAPEELIMVKGDIVCRGERALAGDVTPAMIRDAYVECFNVLSYSVNKRGSKRIHHIRVSGS